MPRSHIFYSILVFSLGLIAYSLIILTEIQGDTIMHNKILLNSLENGSVPIPPLYYLTVYLFSGFSHNLLYLCYAAIAVLALTLLFKYHVTMKLIKFLDSNSINRSHLYILALSLLILMPILTGFAMYLGKPSPNVWHNSTIMFLMPFAVLLFLYTGRIIQEGGKRNLISIFFILIVLNVLIKPSFLFVFISLPVLYYIYYGFDKKFTIFLLGSIVALVLIYLETQYIYYSSKDPFALRPTAERNEIIIAPFVVWSKFSSNIPLYFLSGCAFPLAYLLMNLKKIKHDFLLSFSWLLFIGSILIFILFAESGNRMYHANFYWQIVPSLYLLFTVSITQLFKTMPYQLDSYSTILKMNFKYKFLFTLFLLHLISGGGYLIKLLILRSYI